MAGGRPICVVVDTDTAVDRRAAFMPRSVGDLERRLHEYMSEEPRILEVELPLDRRLWVGIGGEWAAVTAYPIAHAPPTLAPHWTAWSRGPLAAGPRAFINGWVPFEFETEALLPPDEAIGIVLHVVRTGELPDSHLWGPPGPGQYRWGPGGTQDEWSARLREYAARLRDDVPF